MSSFISCTMHLVLLGWRCQGGLWQARGKCDIQTTFWSQNLSFTEKAEQKHKKNSQSTFPNITQQLSLKTTYWATFDIRSTESTYNHTQRSRGATECLLDTDFLSSSFKKRSILKRLTKQQVSHTLSCNSHAQLRSRRNTNRSTWASWQSGTTL